MHWSADIPVNEILSVYEELGRHSHPDLVEAQHEPLLDMQGLDLF